MFSTRVTIIILWLTGVVAAAQLAKFSVLATTLRAQFQLTLPQTGLLISLLEVGGAVFGFVVGMALGRTDARRALLLGLALLTITTAVEAVARAPATMFGARAVEGLGYLLVVIAAPTMIVGQTMAGAGRDAAMVLWGSFVPIGIGIGSALTGWAAQLASTRGVLMIWAATTCLLMAIVVARIAPAPSVRRHGALPAIGAWLLSAGFGCYTLVLCAMTALLPTFLHEFHGAAIPTASTLTGLVALSALPGSLVALWATRSIGRSSRARLAMLAGALLAAAALAQFIYRVGGTAASVSLAAAALLLAGVARTLVFTRLAAVSGAESASDPRIAASQGLLTQFGAAGALAGPPIGAQIVATWNWHTLGLLIGTLMLLLFVLMAAAERYARATPAAGERPA